MQLWPKIRSLNGHELLFYLFLLILPFQTRILYSPSSAYIDWYLNYSLAFFVYLSDLILFSCFITWFLFDPPKIDKNRLLGLSMGFLGLTIVSLFHVKHLDLGLYQTIKWLELLLLVAYISINVKNIAQAKLMALLLFIGGVIQAVIGLAQFHMQHMVGLTLLGEYIAPIGTPGLASITMAGEKLVRAYGTMPHPNVLGAFLVLCLGLSIYLVACLPAMPLLKPDNKAWQAGETGKGPISTPDLIRGRDRFGKRLPRPPDWRVGQVANRSKWFNLFMTIGLIIILLGLFVTFSRLAWAGGALVLLSSMIYYWKVNRQTLIVVILSIIVSCVTIGLAYPDALKARVINLDQTSISDRKFFNSLGWDLAIHYPILGAGVGNYVPALLERQQLAPWQYQPPHNIFIFLAAELGILAAILFTIILFEIFSKSWVALHESFGFAILTGGIVFLLMAQFDHYFVTIQQGRLIFFTALGLVAALPNLYEKS